MKDFFSKCDKIRKKLQIWSHLLKKSLIKNFTFFAVHVQVISSFHATGVFLYPLKTSENQR